MLHLAVDPGPRLAPFVQSLWIQEEPATPADESVEPTVLLPVGYATLVFEYGEPFEELDERGAPRRLAPALIAGPFARAVRVRALGRTGLVLVPFRPWGAQALFPGAAQCAGRFVELEELVPAGAVQRVLDELHEARDSDARRAVVERFLLERARHAASDERLVAAVACIEREDGRAPIETVATRLGTGRRQLTRCFAHGLGLSPKAFARIVRFQAALRGARAGASLSTVALRAGFSDQAHLAHEFRDLAGCAARTVLARVEQRAVGRCFNGERAHPGRSAIYL